MQHIRIQEFMQLILGQLLKKIQKYWWNIVATNNVSIYSENGDIKNSKKLSIHENDYHNVYTDVRGSGDIVGNKISIVANNVENLGADIKAQDKIQIGAKKNLVIGNLEAIDKKVKNGGKILYQMKRKLMLEVI